MKILMWILLVLNALFMGVDIISGQVDWSTLLSGIACVMLAFALDVDTPPR